MLLGYNTNGFAHHRLKDALHILADLGYSSIAITLDHHALDPNDPLWPRQCEHVCRILDRLQLHCVIETGARFLLDPRRKHQPTLMSAVAYERKTRFDFLRQAIEIAQLVHADAVSFWSGAPSEPGAEDE